jgi:4-hydroxybenzoate polyprenyltransferase
MSDNELPDRGLKAWFSLFRPPNLLTVPGDPLAGTLLAAASLGVIPPLPPLLALIGAALCLYAAGLLANDFFDRSVDARERPSRPIPSGTVSAPGVLVAALLLTLAGLLLAAEGGKASLSVASLLAASSWFYNAIGKRIAWLGPLNMGLCRGLSLLMGAALMGPDVLTGTRILLAASLLTVFIALITLAARNEACQNDSHRIPTWLAWTIPLVLATGLLGLIHTPGLALGLVAMALFWAGLWSINLSRASSPAATQRAIGGLIRGLILVQTALCAASGPTGEACALLLLIAFPIAGWLGKWFYGS